MFLAIGALDEDARTRGRADAREARRNEDDDEGER